MHLLRLLICARDLLRRGRLVLDVGENRDRLLAVRRGQVEWAEVEAWRMAVLGPRRSARLAAAALEVRS